MKKQIAPRDSWIQLKAGEKVRIDEKLAKRWYQQIKGLREIRGNIIALTVEIELILDQIICALFFPILIKQELSEENRKRQEDINKLFDNFVLKERPMQFNSKIHLFEKLCLHHHLLKHFQSKELIKNLDDIRKVRNRFSHNTITFIPKGNTPNQNLVPILTCFDKEISLDDSYFDSLNKLYNQTMENLENLLKMINNVNNS